MRWKLAAVSGWAGVLVLVVLGAAPNGDEIRARRIVLEDERGRPCIRIDATGPRLTTDTLAQPSVTLLNPASGKPNVVMTSDSLLFYSPRFGDSPPLSMNVMNGNPMIMLQTPKGEVI